MKSLREKPLDTLAGEEVIEADHIVLLNDQSFAKMGAQKSGAAGNEDAELVVFFHSNSLTMLPISIMPAKT